LAASVHPLAFKLRRFGAFDIRKPEDLPHEQSLRQLLAAAAKTGASKRASIYSEKARKEVRKRFNADFFQAINSIVDTL
jgi:hypothetical protein